VNIQYIDKTTKVNWLEKDGPKKAAAESFSRRYSDVMSVVRKNSEKVKEINEKILELIDIKRMYLLDTHTEVGRFLSKDIFLSNVHKAYEEYERVGMDSELVRDVVMSTRSLFFDDTSGIFRKYEFVSFIHDSLYDNSYKLWFSNNKKEFAISIPEGVKKLSALNRDENIDSMFMVLFNTGKYSVASMGSEMTIEEIRNGLKAFVNDNPVQSSKTPPSLGGYITPLRVLIDKYYGDNLNANDVDVPYYFRRENRTNGLV